MQVQHTQWTPFCGKSHWPNTYMSPGGVLAAHSCRCRPAIHRLPFSTAARGSTHASSLYIPQLAQCGFASSVLMYRFVQCSLSRPGLILSTRILGNRSRYHHVSASLQKFPKPVAGWLTPVPTQTEQNAERAPSLHTSQQVHAVLQHPTKGVSSLPPRTSAYSVHEQLLRKNVWYMIQQWLPSLPLPASHVPHSSMVPLPAVSRLLYVAGRQQPSKGGMSMKSNRSVRPCPAPSPPRRSPPYPRHQTRARSRGSGQVDLCHVNPARWLR